MPDPPGHGLHQASDASPQVTGVAEGSRHLAQAHGDDCQIVAARADGNGAGHKMQVPTPPRAHWPGTRPTPLSVSGRRRDSLPISDYDCRRSRAVQVSAHRMSSSVRASHPSGRPSGRASGGSGLPFRGRGGSAAHATRRVRHHLHLQPPQPGLRLGDFVSPGLALSTIAIVHGRLSACRSRSRRRGHGRQQRRRSRSRW